MALAFTLFIGGGLFGQIYSDYGPNEGGANRKAVGTTAPGAPSYERSMAGASATRSSASDYSGDGINRSRGVDLRIRNGLSEDIYYLYVIPTGAGRWGKDLLGQYYLPPDSQYRARGLSTSSYTVVAETSSKGKKTYVIEYVNPELVGDITISPSHLYSEEERGVRKEVTVRNETGADILYVYVALTDSIHWGGDELGEEEFVPDGREVSFDYMVDSQFPFHEILAEDVNGRRYRLKAQDFKNNSVFTLRRNSLFVERESGSDLGREEGYSRGYEDGYSAGYEAGYAAAVQKSGNSTSARPPARQSPPQETPSSPRYQNNPQSPSQGSSLQSSSGGYQAQALPSQQVLAQPSSSRTGGGNYQDGYNAGYKAAQDALYSSRLQIQD